MNYISKFLLMGIFSTSFLHCETAITFSLNGGRLGDCLLNYIKAKWIAVTYDLPLYVPSFKHIDKFALYKQDLRATRRLRRRFKRVMSISTDAPVQKYRTNDSILFSRTFYFYAENWKHKHDIFAWDNLYNNEEFLHKIKENIRPITNYKPITLPQNVVTVAMHVRKGCGGDSGVSSVGILKGIQQLLKKRVSLPSDRGHPLKFPPDDFYIKALKLLYDHLGSVPLYVQIFTDYYLPQQLIEYYKSLTDNDNITFVDARFKNVIDDLFDMTHFDCLIRPDSSFSKVVDLIGKNTITVYPIDHHWQKGRLFITKIRIQDKGNVFIHEE